MEFGRHLSWLREDPLSDLREARREKLLSGEPVVDLSMINPDFAPPRVIMDRLMEASMKSDNHRYAVSRGIRKLREAFVSKYRARFEVSLDAEHEVCVTMGTKDALSDTLQALCEPGERVLLSSPTYPAHLSAVRLAQLQYDFFTCTQNEEEMLMEIEGKLSAGRHKVILLNFPNNPTGSLVTRSFYDALVVKAKRIGAFIINDFVYGEMAPSGVTPPSLLASKDALSCCLETYSLSKAYNVPGWRVGALHGNREAIHQVARLKSHIDYGIFLPIQLAAAAALTAKEDLVRPTAERYQQRCRLLSNLMSGIGIESRAPLAGASVWGALPSGVQGIRFCTTLLREKGVLVMPGAQFGDAWANFIRVAAVAPEEKLRDVISRMKEVL